MSMVKVTYLKKTLAHNSLSLKKGRPGDLQLCGNIVDRKYQLSRTLKVKRSNIKVVRSHNTVRCTCPFLSYR